MNLERFLAERAGAWGELEALVDRCATRHDQLAPAEVLRLGTLYRAAAADLALARRLYPMAAGTERLGALVVRAHAAVYARATRTQTAGEFFGRGLWEQVWAQRANLAVAGGVMVGAVVLGVLWALFDPLSASGILPAGSHVTVGSRGAFYGISVPARGGLAVEIFVNNIEVSMLAIGGGFTFGILTAYSLAYNGALLGVLGTLEWRGGGFDQFVRLIVPHGLLELSCIALAGAGGMAIARALIDPGRRSRADALAAMVPSLGALVLGVMAFLVVAGLTEGFVTPWDLPAPAAVGLGVVLAGGFWSMVVVRGRRVSAAGELPATDRSGTRVVTAVPTA
ncbi:MAG: stage II sporulation protein M [Actinomycetota bacterium]|jgi:uncharacterized membrane protein SpoIIM required for sporulation|nr:stage II sporulation protein M [Actinomycetota bacterium]